MNFILTIVALGSVAGLVLVARWSIQSAERMATRVLSSDRSFNPSKELGKPEPEVKATSELQEFMAEQQTQAEMDRIFERAERQK